MYGCHYSSPGYVVFYLMRSDPQLMLRLQVSGSCSQVHSASCATAVGCSFLCVCRCYCSCCISPF